MKKSELKQIIKEVYQKRNRRSSKLNEASSGKLNISGVVDDALWNAELNSIDMTIAGMIDEYISDVKYGGDYDKYEDDNGYNLRDEILNKVQKMWIKRTG